MLKFDIKINQTEISNFFHLSNVRNSFLHQLYLKGKTDPERYLSDLGREQAVLTGHRLAELNLPLTYLVSSTMTRAQQTAGLIR